MLWSTNNVFRIFEAATALSVAALLSGCAGIGVGVLGNAEATVTNPRISFVRGELHRTGRPVPWTKAEDLLKYWGPPDRIKRAGARTEMWTYDAGPRWNGIGLLVAIVPIPLMLPVGTNHIEFHIQDDWVMSAAALEHEWIATYGCVLVLLPHGNSVCHFGSFPANERALKAFDVRNTVYRIRVVTETAQPVTIIFTYRDAQTARESDDRFDLAPKQSKHILVAGHGQSLSATLPNGTTVVRRTRPDALNEERNADNSLFYLITGDRIVPVPTKHWDDWEAHVGEIRRIPAE